MTLVAQEIRRWKTDDELTREEARERKRAARGCRPVPVFATDEWRAHVDAQVAEIAQRRDDATRKLRDAERALGVAVVEGTSAPGARKRIEDARSELQALTAAESEIRERDERDAKSHSEAEHRVRRADAYRWAAAYVTRVDTVMRAREALIAAENDLRSIGQNALIVNGRLAGLLPEETGMDVELLAAVHNQGTVGAMRVGDVSYSKFLDLGSQFTPARCAELREKAERLAAAEETP
jgi:hypothetical protein